MSELKKLQAERENLIRQLSISLFQIFGILFIPVIAAVFFGKFLDTKYNTGALVTFGCAVLAMSISWIYIWKIYKRIDTKMIDLDTQIKEEKNKEGGGQGESSEKSAEK